MLRASKVSLLQKNYPDNQLALEHLTYKLFGPCSLFTAIIYHPNQATSLLPNFDPVIHHLTFCSPPGQFILHINDVYTVTNQPHNFCNNFFYNVST